jgi:hypothetical protein
MAQWAPGDTIVWHEIWNDRVWAARPLTVVEDHDDRLLLWCPLGTRRTIPAPPPDAGGDPVIANLARGTWTFADHAWDVSTLLILRPGDWHATWVSWHPDGSHYGWYVNFQTPFRRTRAGVEAMDLMLDIIVEPDLSTWRWKDEAQFDEIARRGIFDAPTAAHVRDEAHEVIARIETLAPPFTDPWPAWRPDPTWAVPQLPEDWADLPV